MLFLYSIAIRFYAFMIAVASVFSKKARLWWSGRKGWRKKLARSFPVKEKVVWFHCASLGEFEQGLPVMKHFKKEFPDSFLLVTFFSPSGYEARKSTPAADYVCYLPVDTKKNASDFLDMVKPDSAFFVKYDFWFHFLKELQHRNIPSYFIASLFRPSQYFFKSTGRWARKYLQGITAFFVQDRLSKSLLETIGVSQALVSGDTRFDRTLELSENPQPLPLIEDFGKSSFLLVGGSTWPPEEALLHSLSKQTIPGLKIIIAPHDVSPRHIQIIKKQFGEACLCYSEASSENIGTARILVIDCIGILSKIYYYTDIALIGGAFGKGLHNILEALTYGVPVFFGPNIKKFPEAQQTIETGCGFKVANEREFSINIIQLMQDREYLTRLHVVSKDFVKNRTGATEIIFGHIQKNLSGIFSNDFKQIRPFLQKDMKQILKIWESASPMAHHFIEEKYWIDRIDDMRHTYIPSSVTFVYEEKESEEIVGFYSMNENHLEAMFVAPGKERKGIGTAFMKHAKLMHPHMTLAVYTENESAVAFYRKEQFQIVTEQINPETNCKEYIMEFKQETHEL